MNIGNVNVAYNFFGKRIRLIYQYKYYRNNKVLKDEFVARWANSIIFKCICNI